MFKVATTLSVILSALLTTTEAKVSWGKCPKVKYMDQSNFMPWRYSGKWYEIVRDW